MQILTSLASSDEEMIWHKLKLRAMHVPMKTMSFICKDVSNMSLYSVSLPLTVWREIISIFLSYLGPTVIHLPAGMALVKRPATRGEQMCCWSALTIFLHPNIHCRAINAEHITGNTSLWAWSYRLKRVSKLVSIRLTYVEKIVPMV